MYQHLTPKKRKGEDAHGHDAHGDDAHGHDAHGHGGHDDDDEEEEVHDHPRHKAGISFIIAMVLFIASNFALGIFAQPIAEVIKSGISLLG